MVSPARNADRLLAIAPSVPEQAVGAAPDCYQWLFESAPDCYLVLDAQSYQTVGVTDAYLHATMTQRSAIQGKRLFEVFPNEPGDSRADGINNLLASLERVKSSGQPDVMAVQRYPIRQPDRQAPFKERWWSLIHSPVLAPDGRIRYIIHRVEDVTAYMGAIAGGRGEHLSFHLAQSPPRAFAGAINNAVEWCVAVRKIDMVKPVDYLQFVEVLRTVNIYWTISELP